MPLRSLVLSNEVRWLGLIIPTAMLGALTRLALTSLTTYPSPTLSPVIYSQALGCLVIGISSGLKPSLEYLLKDLSLSISTGYCGSLTTFSTFMLDLFKAYTYITPSGYTDRNAKGAAFDFIGQVLSTTGISIACTQLGLGVGTALQSCVTLPEKPLRSRDTVSLTVAISLGVVSYIITLALALSPTTHTLRLWTYALLFAPAGAWLRHKLAQYFNKGSLPYGTLASNVLGTVFTCLGYGLVHLSGSGGGAVRCHVLHALQDGLGGALSTVSSLAMELNGMGVSRRAFLYAGLSLFLGQAVCVVVAGSMKWSERGFGDACAV